MTDETHPLHSLLDRLVGARPVRDHLRPPSTDEQLEGAAIGFRLRLPEAVEQLYRWHAGTDPQAATLDRELIPGLVFLTPAEAVALGGRLRRERVGWRKDCLPILASPDASRLVGVRCTSGHIEGTRSIRSIWTLMSASNRLKLPVRTWISWSKRSAGGRDMPYITWGGRIVSRGPP